MAMDMVLPLYKGSCAAGNRNMISSVASFDHRVHQKWATRAAIEGMFNELLPASGKLDLQKEPGTGLGRKVVPGFSHGSRTGKFGLAMIWENGLFWNYPSSTYLTSICGVGRRLTSARVPIRTARR
jgi:hypothetical protein